MMHGRSVRAALVAVALGAVSACGGGGGGGGSDAGSPAAAAPDPAANAATSPSGDSLLVAKSLIDRTDETSEPVSLASVGTADRSETGEPAALR